jgi:hypothetical protein
MQKQIPTSLPQIVFTPTYSPIHSIHLTVSDLVSGANPSSGEAIAGVYGGVPGDPANAYMQWLPVFESDNTIRYVFLSI